MEIYQFLFETADFDKSTDLDLQLRFETADFDKSTDLDLKLQIKIKIFKNGSETAD